MVDSNKDLSAQVHRTWRDSLTPHCERIVLESGKQIYVFWADKTFRNIFERISYIDNGLR